MPKQPNITLSDGGTVHGYKNKEHFTSAILLRIANPKISFAKIGSILGYSRETIERWFKGGNEEFSKESLMISTRQLLDLLPQCIKLIKESLNMADTIGEKFKEKTKLEPKDFECYISAVDSGSKRALTVLETLHRILVATPAIQVFAKNAQFNTGANQKIFNTPAELLNEILEVKKMAEEAIDAEVVDEKEEEK